MLEALDIFGLPEFGIFLDIKHLTFFIHNPCFTALV